MEMPALLRCPVCGIHLDIQNPEARMNLVCQSFGGKKFCFCSEVCRKHFVDDHKVAYFSMEIGIANDIPTYSGGLGILAGDIVKSSADLRLQMIALTLVSRKGYFRQKINEKGEQEELPDEWDPSKIMTLLPNKAKVTLENRQVTVQAWLYEHLSPTGGMVPIIFIDTDVEGNAPEDRKITDQLYGGDKYYRLKQEIILGIGGVKLLRKMPFKIGKYHMNEGHPSLLTLELLRENSMNFEKVRNMCVFTTHTPVGAAFDKFPYDVAQRAVGEDYSLSDIKQYAGEDALNTTQLALELSKYINGVSEAHVEFSKKLFPGRYIRSITNGVHSYTWTCSCFRELYDKYIPSWSTEPILLVRALEIPNRESWDAHVMAKNIMIDYVKKNTEVELDPKVLTIGFARRATGYKRANLIFSDLDRLREVNKKGAIQIVFAGKAHPFDVEGKKLIKQINEFSKDLKDEIKIVYLENYKMDIASKLTSGVDVWLNTPLPPMEASGTSGMKAAHNGVINFSILDGWWVEGCVEGVTGWGIGPRTDESIPEKERRKMEINDLYNKLEYLIIPTYYKRRDNWIGLMKNSIARIAYYFQTQWVMRRYISEAYMI